MAKISDDLLASIRAMIEEATEAGEGMTQSEWRAQWGTSERATIKALKTAIGAGLMRPTRVRRMDMAGRSCMVIAYVSTSQPKSKAKPRKRSTTTS